MKQEFKNAKIPIGHGHADTKLNEVDKCIGAIVVVVKTEIDNMKTGMDVVKRKIENNEAETVEELMGINRRRDILEIRIPETPHRLYEIAACDITMGGLTKLCHPRTTAECHETI